MPSATYSFAPPPQTASSATVVLIHGAWHDESTWDMVTPLLHAAGVSTRSMTLPSTNPGPALASLPDDVDAVTAIIDQTTGPVVLVGHSYGGMVISEAGHHQRVTHLVYLAAFCPIEGESAADLAVGNPPPLTVNAIEVNADGTMTIKPELATDTFYGDLEPGEAQRRVAMLAPTSASVFAAIAGPPAWHKRATTYVVCVPTTAPSAWIAKSKWPLERPAMWFAGLPATARSCLSQSWWLICSQVSLDMLSTI
jgi:pimeloyl-ACP methyl ester carboxylesterase